MLINPILPIWLMAIICVGLLFLKRKGVWPYIRQIVIILLLFVINLRPMLPGNETIEATEQKLDSYVLFVVDDTLSMLAADYQGDLQRLEGMRRDCGYIVDCLPGTHFGVLTFHNVASQICPYTNNGEHVKNVLDSIYPVETFYAKGTSFDVAKEGMLLSLKNAAASTDGQLFVFFVSDGEITSQESVMPSFSEVSPFVAGGAVLGYGTKEGGTMTYRSMYEDVEDTVVMDYDAYPFEDAISKFDEDNLKKIAKDLSLRYFYRNSDNKAELDKVIQKIRSEANVVRENKLVVKTQDPMIGAKDLYFIPASILLFMLLLEALLFIRHKDDVEI